MDLDDIKERYKILPMAARIGVAVVVGVLPIVYIFLDEGSILSDQLTELHDKESQARAKFERARDRKGNLPKLEENLAFTEEQLNKAKRLLPDSFRVEDVLQKVATTARDVGVTLDSFKPLEEVKKDMGYPTVEIPIEAGVSGRFGDIGHFIDQILRSEMALFVKTISMTPAATEKEPSSSLRPDQPETLQAKDLRQYARERAVLTIVAYRSQTESEISMLPAGGVSTGATPQEDGRKMAPDGGIPPPSDTNHPPPGAGAS
jgi:Tfp pilus assembly protein PilO